MQHNFYSSWINVNLSHIYTKHTTHTHTPDVKDSLHHRRAEKDWLHVAVEKFTDRFLITMTIKAQTHCSDCLSLIAEITKQCVCCCCSGCKQRHRGGIEAKLSSDTWKISPEMGHHVFIDADSVHCIGLMKRHWAFFSQQLPVGMKPLLNVVLGVWGGEVVHSLALINSLIGPTPLGN